MEDGGGDGVDWNAVDGWQYAGFFFLRAFNLLFFIENCCVVGFVFVVFLISLWYDLFDVLESGGREGFNSDCVYLTDPSSLGGLAKEPFNNRIASSDDKSLKKGEYKRILEIKLINILCSFRFT